MRSDPIYLFQDLTWKASLGVLSVAGNVCRVILAEKLDGVKVSLVRLKKLCLIVLKKFWRR